MKKSILFIFAIVFSITAFCQGGVNFEHLTFDEALAKAKAEGKLVLMDCYTSWCGPCKWMAETVFPQEKAGTFFNPKFISVKYDMEKGEGLELAKKFKVRGYPTFYIIRPDGSVQHEMVGGRTLDAFIARVERGLNEKTSLDYLNKVYETGKINKKELINYLIALQEAGDDDRSKKIKEELNVILKDKDRLQKEYWPIMHWAKYGSDDVKFIVENLSAFRKNFGKEEIDPYVSSRYSMAIDNSTREAEPAKVLEQIRQELSTLDLPDKDQLLNKIEIMQASINQDVKKIISLAEQISPEKFDEVWTIVGAFDAIKEKASKEELKHMLELGDKFIAHASEDVKSFIENAFKELKDVASSRE